MTIKLLNTTVRIFSRNWKVSEIFMLNFALKQKTDWDWFYEKYVWIYYKTFKTTLVIFCCITHYIQTRNGQKYFVIIGIDINKILTFYFLNGIKKSENEIWKNMPMMIWIYFGLFSTLFLIWNVISEKSLVWHF